MNNRKAVRNTDVYISLFLFFIVISGYFFIAGNYILFFQETRSLFIFSGDYLHSFLIKPGGALVYSAKFLTQFYTDAVAGPLILSVVLTLPGAMFYFINKRLIPGISFSLFFLMVPSFLLVFMQANYYHMMEYNLGFVMILVYYLLTVSSENKYHQIKVLILFPLFYYLTGAYAMIFGALYISHNLIIVKGKRKIIFASLILLIGLISFFVFMKFLFLQTVGQLIMYPFPLLENSAYKATFFILTGYIVILPVVYGIINRLKQSRLNTRIYSVLSTITFFILTSLLIYKLYNSQTARVIELERLVFAEQWNEAIDLHEKKPSRNLIGQYFYNIALSETDQLCDRMFNGRQDFGTGALVLPWGDDHLDRGAYFYYSIGLVNEAHRWAYEEMVVYGYRPQNIKLLAKTSLIKGDYRMARKYTSILKKTIYYRTWAKKYEAMANNPELISTDPDLSVKISLLPKTSFFIQFNEPQNNLPLILEGQPDNRKAIEYYMAGLLLTKKVEIAVNNVRNMKASGYTRIPRHIEEAILLYYNSSKVLPDLGGLTISQESQVRFDHYFSSYVTARNNPATLQASMEKQFGNTFWYYFQFK